MKIAVIAPSFVPSPAANSIQVMKVCQAFVQAGAEIALWVPLREGQTLTHGWDELRAFYGIETEFLIHWVKEDLRFRRYDFAWKSVGAAKNWGADVVYTWMVQAGLFAFWLHMLPALELHMLPTGKLGPVLLRFFSKSNRKKLLLPITLALKERLAKDYHINFLLSQTQIAPMGSEPERYVDFGAPSEVRKLLGLPERMTAIYTGHLYEGRGMELLLSLGKAFPDVTFLWVGGREPELGAWRKRVLEEGAANITLTGFVHNQELPRYQSAAEILLMPYQRNVGVSGAGDTADVCSPMKLFDYLSAGRAILTSDLPVFHEILNDRNAVFCAPDDLEEWKAGFRRLVDDEVLRTALSEQSKKDAIQYSWFTRAQNTLAKLANLQ